MARPRKDSNSETVSVVLNQSIAGHRTDAKGNVRSAFAYNSGSTIELPAVEAERYVDAGIASYPTEE